METRFALQGVRFLFRLCLAALLLPLAAQAAETPRRIISLGPINTENVYLLGAGERLVANTIYCVRPAAARTKTRIGSMLDIQVEKIIALHPDLVLATALTKTEQVAQLQRAGIRVVRFRQPDSFDRICRQFLALGELLGCSERARQVVATARAEVAALQKSLAGRPRPKVFLQVGTQPLFGAIPGSFINDFIVLAGGENIICDQQNGVTKREKVISLDPDFIIIAIMGSESGIAGQEKRRWQRLASLNAVRQGQVVIIEPDLLCSPSPMTFVATVKMIARLLHPDVV